MKHAATLWVLAVPLLVAGMLASPEVHAQRQSEFGLELRKSAQSADLDMPVYPKAMPQRDLGDDSAAVTLGAWGGGFGFRLAVSKLASDDTAPQVAAFYRAALARHGEVVECAALASGSPTRSAAAPASRSKPDTPNCDDDRPSKLGSLVLKVGTKKDFRLVQIEPMPGGSHFQLVRLVAGQ
jgi:hypothetical protein